MSSQIFLNLYNSLLVACFRAIFFVSLLWVGLVELCAQFYPIHGTVQWPAPQSPYLVDYYSGSRDRLIITLHNRDLQQPLLFARLRVRIKSHGFLAETREEMPYPMLELLAGTPTRLTATDLMPYLRPENLRMNGRLREGKLPTGFTEFSVQVVDFYSGKVLSTWHTGRAYLDVKKPPILNVPERDEQVSYRDPIFIRFQWMPRHQGLAGTEYEFVLKELLDNGAAPQSAFAYGNEIYRVRTRNTTLNYTHLEPILLPNRRYAWQVQAIARDGIDEIGMFENRGFSEIYWFSLNENCPVPTGLKAQARYAKVDFSWNRVIGATGYMLACRPKTSKNIYEWSEVQSYGERTTIAQLKPGWTYEWRVGTLCTGDRPIYSPIQEVTLPKNNEELLARCGKEPPRRDLRQEPRLDVAPGDTITIGGDYPMIVMELRSLGDGWYSGRGKTSLRSIIEVPHVALRFDRLRINVDNFQIDGLVEAVYDDKKPLANLDQLDDGGKALSRSALRIRERKVAFALPDTPEMSFNPETGELETTDAEGKPQRIKLDLPEGGDYASAFPMVITDAKGNEYQVSEQSSTYGVDERSPNRQTEGDSIGGRKALRVERVERIGAFDRETLERSFGLVCFRSSAQARYALDLGDESWYLGSVKMDAFYKEFATEYTAPWKLIPLGERDVVEAYYEGSKGIDLSRVRFASTPDSPALPADYDEARKAWTLTLPAAESNSSYEAFALYEGKVIGKLRVVSYPKQNYRVRLVPVNGQSVGDISRLSQQLNSIYNKHGVSFTLYEGEGVRAELKAKSLSQDLRKLQDDYEAQHSLSGDEVCLFILSAELSKGSKYEELEGLMPRGKRFGYIFAGNSPNEEALARTLAHELGHGLFTLQHTFDDEYGGKKSKGKTQNLMDYTEGATELAAFQWNVMAHTAPFTALDREKEAELRNSTEDLIALQKLEEELKKRGAGYIGLRLRCTEYSSKDKKPTVQRVQLPEQRSLKIVGLQSYIVSHSQTYVYGIVSLDSTVVETNTQKQTWSEKQRKKISKSEAELLLLHFDERDRLRYCEANTQNYPDICSLNDSADLTKYIEQFKQDILLCRSSEQAPTTLGDVRQILLQAKAVFGKQIDFALGDKVYRLNSTDQLEEVSEALRDEDINRGAWSGDAEEYVRLTTDADGIIQFQAFGISSKLKLAKGKRADLIKVAQHIQEKSNAYLKQHQVRDFQDSPAKRGLDLNANSQVFADDDAFRLDNNAAYIRFVSEGYDAVKTLLKTSELPEKIYRSSEKDKVVVHMPGLVTGATEVVAQKVTDLTSLGVLAYDIVVDEQVRKNLWQQLLVIKEQIGEDPKQFFPILGDVLVSVATGNSVEEWRSIGYKEADFGKKSHLLTRATGNAVVTAMAVGAIVKKLPEVTEELSKAIKKSKKVLKEIVDNPLDELNKLKPNVRF